MKKLTVLGMVLAAATVRADPGVSLIPSAEFSVRLAESDQKQEAIEGRQRSAVALRVAGTVGLVTSGATLALGMGGWVVFSILNGLCGTTNNNGGCTGASSDTTVDYTPVVAVVIISAVTLVSGVACFIAAAVVSPSAAEEAAVVPVAHEPVVERAPSSPDDAISRLIRLSLNESPHAVRAERTGMATWDLFDAAGTSTNCRLVEPASYSCAPSQPAAPGRVAPAAEPPLPEPTRQPLIHREPVPPPPP